MPSGQETDQNCSTGLRPALIDIKLTKLSNKLFTLTQMLAGGNV